MNKLDIILAGLAALMVVGVVVLSAIDKSFDPLVPSLTAIVGFLIGGNRDRIAAVFRRG